MDTFYRVEDDDHVGPYQLGSSMRWSGRMGMVMAHSDEARHPDPRIDYGYRFGLNQVSAFKNMRQLFAWFGGWLPKLIHLGYHVVKVEGFATYDDGRQVVIYPINWR